MKEMLKMMLVLSLICGLAGVSLATLKEATASRIEEQVLTFVQAPAINAVLNGYENNPIKDRKQFEIDGHTVTVFPSIVQGRLKAVALETNGKGYGGNIGVMVGFNLATDTLSGIGITTLKETPGVGARVVEHGYTTQFQGHAIGSLALKKNGGDIEAVAGATISSTGTVSAIQDAIAIYNTLKPKFADSWS